MEHDIRVSVNRHVHLVAREVLSLPDMRGLIVTLQGDSTPEEVEHTTTMLHHLTGGGIPLIVKSHYLDLNIGAGDVDSAVVFCRPARIEPQTESSMEVYLRDLRHSLDSAMAIKERIQLRLSQLQVEIDFATEELRVLGE